MKHLLFVLMAAFFLGGCAAKQVPVTDSDQGMQVEVLDIEVHPDHALVSLKVEQDAESFLASAQAFQDYIAIQLDSLKVDSLFSESVDYLFAQIELGDSTSQVKLDDFSERISFEEHVFQSLIREAVAVLQKDSTDTSLTKMELEIAMERSIYLRLEVAKGKARTRQIQIDNIIFYLQRTNQDAEDFQNLSEIITVFCMF